MKSGCADLDQIRGWLVGLGYTVHGDSVEPDNRNCDPSLLVEWSLHVVDEDLERDTEGLSLEKFEDLLEVDRSNHEVVAIGPGSLGEYTPTIPGELEDIDFNVFSWPGQAYLRTQEDVTLWHQWAEKQRQRYWKLVPMS